MSIPNFSRVFSVVITKHGPSKGKEYVEVLADGIDEAIEKGYEYADLLDEPDVVCYEVTSADLVSEIFLWADEETE